MERLEKIFSFHLVLITLTASLFMVESVYPVWYSDICLTRDKAKTCKLYRKGGIYVDANNTVHLVWYNDKLNPGYPEIFYMQLDNRQASRVSFDGYKSTDPAIVVDKKGVLHVVWRDNKEGGRILYKTGVPSNWGSLKVICTKPFKPDNPAICLDNNGTIHVVYEAESESGKNIFYQEINHGTITDPLQITFSSGNTTNPVIKVDRYNNLHVVFEDSREGNSEIYYLTKRKGKWLRVKRLTFNKAWSGYPMIAVDNQGRVHVVWEDKRSGKKEIYYRMKTGVNWLPVQQLTFKTKTPSTPDIAVTSYGTIHVSWMDNRDDRDQRHPWNFEIYHIFGDGKNWSPVKRLTYQEAYSCNAQMLVDKQDNLYVFFEDMRNGGFEIFYKKYVPKTSKKPRPKPRNRQINRVKPTPTPALTTVSKPNTPINTSEMPVNTNPGINKKKYSPTMVPSATPTYTNTPGSPTFTPTITPTVNWVATLQYARKQEVSSKKPKFTGTPVYTLPKNRHNRPAYTSYYMHRGLKIKEWKYDWGKTLFKPGGVYMSQDSPHKAKPLYSPMEMLKNYYCYTNPPLEGSFSAGNYSIELWLGSPDGPIAGLLRLRLEISDESGSTILELGRKFLSCVTESKGPKVFRSVIYEYEKKLVVKRNRLKISIRLLDSQNNPIYLYMDSPGKGATRLITPLFQSNITN